jgi:hypothetical protein
MIEDEDIYDFLEHRGVKGMHWGVRKSRSSSSKAAKKPKTAAEKKLRNQRILGVAMITASGAIFAANIMARQKNIKMKEMRRATAVRDISQRNKQAEDILKRAGSHKFSEIRTGFKVNSSGVTEPIMNRVGTRAALSYLIDNPRG